MDWIDFACGVEAAEAGVRWVVGEIKLHGFFIPIKE